jgi:argininosuccinate synthase
VLLAAHRDLEAMTLERELAHYKQMLELKYGELIYYGLWYSPLRRALDAFIGSTQERVTGTVRMKLHRGTCTPVGRKSPYSLYSYELATYDKADQFDASLSKGFVQLWGLSARVAAEAERKAGKK